MNGNEHGASPSSTASPTSAGLNSLTHSDVWIYAAAIIAAALKLWIALTTIGTNDVAAFYAFAARLQVYGLEWTYSHVQGFNHPPLVAYFLRGIYALDVPTFTELGITFPFLLRLPGIIADFVVILVLARVRTTLAMPRWALIALALSPVSLMVSGFHGNTDPVMVMFLVFAAVICLRPNAVLCGIFLALSCHIKVIPLLVLPVFAFFWWSRRNALRFGLGFAVTLLFFWLIPLVQFPAPFLKQVVAYGSFWGLWGISYWLRFTGWHDFTKVGFHDLTLAENLVSTALKLTIIAGVLLIAWRRRFCDGQGLFKSLAYAWIIFFILAPGIASQ